MIDNKTLELRVRAQLDGVKDLKGVADAIESIEKAIEKQTAAAKRGENVYDELKASLDSLVIVQKQLKDQASLIGEFQRLEKAISSTETRVANATKRYDEYNKKLREAGETTDAQERRLLNYGKSVESANLALKRQTADRDLLTKAFQEAGIALDSLNALETRNLQVQAQLGTVYQRSQQAISQYAANVSAARAAEKVRAAEAADIAEAERKRIGVINAQIADAQRRAAEAAQLVARDQGLSKLADDAQRAAAGFTELARGTTTLSTAAASLTPRQISLRDAVQGIIDPAKASRSTLAGLEQEVTKLAGSINKIDGPVNEYRATLDRLALAQKAAAQQAGLVDEFRRQVEVLRQTRAEFVQARQQVIEYANAVRQGGEAGQQFTRPLADAQVKLRAAAQAMAEQVSRTREARDQLRGAGIETNNLASAQERLINTTRTASAATTQLGQAIKQYGQEQEKASSGGRGLGIFGDEGRTTLSLLQRIRGEVLALTASYVGLFAVINTGSGAISASKSREGIQNQLAISVGNDRAAIDAEYAYIKGQAERIGIEFESAARGFAKFSAAASLAGRSRQEIRFIFETFSEVGRVANLSTDDLNGVFKALEQVISKGKIQAEELRGQLGDRLFGAFQVAAEALKDQFPDLDAALKRGEVTSSQLLLIAEQYKKTVADQLPAATQSLAAQQARLNTALFDFKLAIGDSGFIDSFSRALVQISAFLRSDDGKKFAEGLGAAFKGAADAVIFLFQNIETVKEALKIVAAIVTGLFVGQVIGSILQGATAFVVLATQVQAATKAVIAFAVAWPAVTAAILSVVAVASAAFAGWQIGTILREKFVEVRTAATYLVTGLAEAWALIKGGFDIAFSAIPAIARNVMKAFLNVVGDAVRKALTIFSSFARAAGLENLANTVDQIGESLTWNYENIAEATKRARQDLAAEIATIRGIRRDMLNDDTMRGVAANQGNQSSVRRIDNALLPANPTARPDIKPEAAKTLSDEELDKRQKKIDALTRSLDELALKTDRTQAETLYTQLAAIDLTYKQLLKRIEAEIVDPSVREAMKQRLQQIIADLQMVTTNRVNKQLSDDQRAFYEKLDKLEAAADRKQLLDLQARQDAIRSRYASLYRDLDVLREKFIANGRDTTEVDAAKARIDAGIGELQMLERRKFAQEELTRRQERYNKAIQTRDAELEAVRVQREVGAISDEVAASEINRINNNARPAIEGLILETQAWATAYRDVFASDEDFKIFMANLEAVRLKQVQVRTEWTMLEKAIISGAVNAINSGLNAMVDSFGKIITGQQSIGEGFKGMLRSFGLFAAQFMQEIAVMIIRMQIFKALQSMGGTLGAVGTAGLGGTVPVRHSGGIVGSLSNRNRNVSAAWFTNAPRYHSGGLMGLRQDEYATILQKGEEVLSKDSPRNIMNGGAGIGGGSNAGSSSMRVVLVDDRTKVAEAMSTPEGERVIVQTIQRNAPTLKAILRG